MRVLLLSDIHANLVALEAVLADADGEWDQVWFLGDLVGYGPQPNECVERLRPLEPLALSGNHDWAVLDKLDDAEFNDDARFVARWTRRMLTPDNRDYLKSLPPVRPQPPFTLVHASPRHPVWEYILDLPTALENFDYFDTSYCLVGHTHVPAVFAFDEANDAVDFALIEDGDQLTLGSHRLIINPGGVGQPRDGDPRAAYALLDTEAMEMTFHRVAYDIAATQALMREMKLPRRLIARLAQGL